MKFKNILWVFFISILPIVELRGAIPVGAALGLPFYVNYLCAVFGNLLPIPFILLFIPKILDFLARFKAFRPIVEWLRKKAMKNRGKIDKSKTATDNINEQEDQTTISEESDIQSVTLENTKRHMPAGAFIGLMLFVLIPVPGTGAWTGALVAALFNYPKKKSFLSIMLGVLGCGVVMCLASYGVVGALEFLAK